MLYKQLLKDFDLQVIEEAHKYGVNSMMKKYEKHFKQLGSGVNATAYLLPSGNVMRLEWHCNESGWHQWMEKVVLKDTTDLTARVGYYSKFKDRAKQNCTRSLSIQERLYPVNRGVKALSGMSDVGYSIARICDSKNPLEKYDDFLRVHENLNRFFPREKVVDYVKVVKQSKLSLNDAHNGNIMFRKEGEVLVLTDPVN